MVPTACRRIVWLAALLPLVASPARLVGVEVFLDDFESGDSCPWGVGTTTCPGFTITTPPLLVSPGVEEVYCYYIHTGNGATLGARRITSSSGALVRYASLLTTHDIGGNPLDVQPPGTLTTSGCDWNGGNLQARRIYTAQEPEVELLLPTDDGAGVPLALEFLAAQPAVLVAHILNDTSDPITTGVTLTAYAHMPGVSYTKTASLTTFDTQLAVPPAATTTSTHTCPVPSAVKFWWFSTHTHGFAQEAKLRNGSSDIVVSTNWAAPAVADFGPPSFYEFGAGEQLTYSCTYFNGSPTMVGFGASYATDESCTGLAYFFPASVPRTCVNNLLLP